MEIEEAYRRIIKTVANYLDISKYQVFVFGSRATGKARKWSDIDVGIIGEKPERNVAISIELDLDDSDMPYKVEVVDFNLVSENFKKIALQKTVDLKEYLE